MPAVVRLVHPAPTLAVVALTAALAAILAAQEGGPATDWRVLVVTASVLGSQILTGALNDWADRATDAVAQPAKPIPAGEITPRAALVVAGIGLAIQVGASALLGPLPLAIGLVASASATAYDLWLSRTPWSFLPYLVSFGLLPMWVAAAVGAPLERVAPASLLVAPYAVAAHLANTIRDFDADRLVGSANLAQRLGRRRAFGAAWVLAMLVGSGVGAAFLLWGRLDPLVAVPGAIGIAAVAQGARSPGRLWAGMLVAAVCWTAAWAIATG